MATTRGNIALIQGAAHADPRRQDYPSAAAALQHARGGGWGWDAIQAVTPNRERSAVLVYRAQGESDTLGRFARAACAKMECIEFCWPTAATLFELSGAQLERDGIALELPELAAELIRIEQISVGDYGVSPCSGEST